MGSAEHGYFNSLAASSTGLCAAGTEINFTATSTGWTWACRGSSGGSTDSSGSAYNASSGTVSIAQAVKYSGCNFTGLIGTANAGTEATGTTIAGTQLTLFNDYVDLISASHCTFIERAINTFDWAPDFTAIASNITAFNARVTGPENHYLGEYVAERVALPGVAYPYTAEGRNFNFTAMCRVPPAAGDGNCVASFNQPEYVAYVTQIVENSINLGIQVYMLGEVDNTDSGGVVATSQLIPLMNTLRAYGASNGLQIVFIAQDPSGGPAYYNNFDFVMGGVYMNADGTIPNTPTVTNKAGKGPPRLWLVKNANGTPFYNLSDNGPGQVIAEFDQFGDPIDDQSELACLSIPNTTAGQAYLTYLKGLSTANCPLSGAVSASGTGFAVAQAAYSMLKNLGVGLWLPGRQKMAFPPVEYTPLSLTLAPSTPKAINFNDEGVLAIGAGQ